MQTKNSLSIEYYNQNAKNYFDRTRVIDLHPIYQRFTRYLKPQATILDAGSGSGRDTKYFLEQGYMVVGMDASEEMVKLSSAYTGQKTLHYTFETMPFINAFDGIWCCASLVHIPPSDLVRTLRAVAGALKDHGVWFLSFMHGDFEQTRQGRYFHYLTETKLKQYLGEVGNLEILDLCVSPSCEQGRDSEWIQCIVRKRYHD
jgi:2-polyprenyl-3-methyl-5-hydroxy-6-metoxy-1,4-benzoquinol methylase